MGQASCLLKGWMPDLFSVQGYLNAFSSFTLCAIYSQVLGARNNIQKRTPTLTFL